MATLMAVSRALDRSGQVDVPAPGCGGLGQTLELGVLVHQADCDRPTRRHTMIDPGIHDHPVGLELLPLAPAMPALPALQLTVDHRRVQGHARGEPFHDGGERLAVRFTGGQIAEHDSLPGEGTRGRTESGPNTSFPRKRTFSQALESLNVQN